ncbi:uncharacterized protein [Rutidosis leptorrhynchoides]|uniref:uncharacterized protein n=1 Tax=Rutidosis leptorrhynchoides TaxID=125765 RepID=UPI003A99D2E9
MDFKAAIWNIRGMCNIDKQNEVMKFIREEKVCLCSIIETHLKPSNIDAVCSKIYGNWLWQTNSSLSTNSCRITVGWNSSLVNVMILHMARQTILCLVETLDKKTKYFCSLVYAGNNGKIRQALWKDLKAHASVVNGYPWILMGDFNTTRNISEHSAGGSHLTEDMKEFCNCINDIEVEDIRSSGFHFTWTKSLKNPLCGTLKKLDRIMCNEEFEATYPLAYGNFLPYLVSDHSPAVLHIPNGLVKKKRAFRFMNHIAHKDNFLSVVENGWKLQVEGYKMFQVVSKLKHLKKDLNKLNWENGNVFKKVDMMRKNLSSCQAAVDQHPHDPLIKKLATQASIDYELAKKDEVILLQQKAKIQWLTEGDKNTKFFHSILKSRKMRCRIVSICDDHGVRYEGDHVADVIMLLISLLIILKIFLG